MFIVLLICSLVFLLGLTFVISGILAFDSMRKYYRNYTEFCPLDYEDFDEECK